MEAMNRVFRVSLVAISAMALGTPQLAQAHFKFLEPPSTWSTENGGKGDPPCGQGTPSGVVTKAQGGHAFTIRVQEFIIHPGHYRIALSTKSRSELPKDPDVMTTPDNQSISAPIDPNPKIPVLADGVFQHTTAPRPAEWKTEVTLPNINCDKCTLQVTEFMAQHGFNKGGGFFYHHCADLQITMDPSLPAAAKAWLDLSK
jgi:hypothetical protein